MLPYENPAVVGGWLRCKLEDRSLFTVDFEQIARAVSDECVGYLGRWLELDGDECEERRARLAVLLQERADSRELDVDWLAAVLGRELAGTGFARDNEEYIEHHMFGCHPDDPVWYADNPHFVRYWLNTLSQDEWEHECATFGQIVPDQILARWAGHYEATDCEPEERRALFTKWITGMHKPSTFFWNDYAEVQLMLSVELAGTAYAHEHETDIRDSFPSPKTIDGETLAYLSGMSMGHHEPGLVDTMQETILCC